MTEEKFEIPHGSPTFRRIYAMDTLRAAFERVKANEGGPGGDGIAIAEYSGGLDRRLARLATELSSGSYWPGPVRISEFAKKSGGFRVLKIPTVTDRIAQTAALIVLGPRLDAEFEDSSFGYRPGRSVQQAVRRVAALRNEGYQWTVDADINDFFDNVRHDRLIKRLSRSIECEDTVDLVERWLDAYGTNGKGLPQGSPISPLLANLYLDDVDEAIERLGLRLVRYADDFVILTRSKEKAEVAMTKVAYALKGEGLELNPDKTRILSFDQTLDFLGHRFVRTMAYRPLEPEEQATPGVLGKPIPSAPASPTRSDDDDGNPRGDLAARQRVLYAMERGRLLTRRGGAIAVLEDCDLLMAVPAAQIDRIDIGPQSRIDGEALRLAAEQGIHVAILGLRHETIASLQPGASGRAERHLAQAAVLLDPEKRVDLARRFVLGRLRNQRALLNRLNRRRKLPTVQKAAHDIGRLTRQLPMRHSVAELMGVEGRAAALYWPALGECLEHGFVLKTRDRQPPPDPVNAVISLLSNFLARDIAAFAPKHGLHPGFGALHEVQDHRPALALDLMEEFRAPLVEGLAVYLFNNQFLKDQHFSMTEDGGVKMFAPTISIIIRQYEAWIDRAVQSPRYGDQTTWRGLIEEQLDALVAHIDGGSSYAPYDMGY